MHLTRRRVVSRCHWRHLCDGFAFARWCGRACRSDVPGAAFRRNRRVTLQRSRQGIRAVGLCSNKLRAALVDEQVRRNTLCGFILISHLSGRGCAAWSVHVAVSRRRFKRSTAAFCENELGPVVRVVARELVYRLAGGKSGLQRAACRLTAGGVRSKRISRKVPQKIYRRMPGASPKFGKGEKVR